MKADLQRMGSKIHTPRILRAGAEILTHMQRLSSGRPVNEAEVRYAVCNQLVCDVFNYKLKLEDRVAGVGEEEPLTLEDYLESVPDLFEPP